jgi:hypothetical protein
MTINPKSNNRKAHKAGAKYAKEYGKLKLVQL